MCLVLIAFRSHSQFPLVVAANRDEFHARPTAPAEFWDGILAGRDLQSGGTWLGVTSGGRFAAVTNFHEPRPKREDDRSRGALVVDFLRSEATPIDYLQQLAPQKDRFAGFGLFVSDGETLGYFSNRGGEPQALPRGIYGLSNHLLDTDWTKLRRGKTGMQELLTGESKPRELAENLLALLGQRNGTDRAETIFVSDPIHGTRSSTVVVSGAPGGLFVERAFDASGEVIETRSFAL